MARLKQQPPAARRTPRLLCSRPETQVSQQLTSEFTTPTAILPSFQTQFPPHGYTIPVPTYVTGSNQYLPVVPNSPSSSHLYGAQSAPLPHIAQASLQSHRLQATPQAHVFSGLLPQLLQEELRSHNAHPNQALLGRLPFNGAVPYSELTQGGFVNSHPRSGRQILQPRSRIPIQTPHQSSFNTFNVYSHPNQNLRATDFYNLPPEQRVITMLHSSSYDHNTPATVNHPGSADTTSTPTRNGPATMRAENIGPGWAKKKSRKRRQEAEDASIDADSGAKKIHINQCAQNIQPKTMYEDKQVGEVACGQAACPGSRYCQAHGTHMENMLQPSLEATSYQLIV